MFSIFATDIVGSETNNKYRRIMTVDNSGNSETLTDYQIFLNVTYDSDMQPDFDDLRFTWYNETSDQEVSIDYWLDKHVDSEYALVWVEVPSIQGLGQEVLYMYYGDPDAVSGSNGEETFVFFDGFSTDTTSNYEVWFNPKGEISWDPNGWLFVSATIRQPGKASNVHVGHKTALIDAREEKFWLETRGKAFGTGVLDYFGVDYAYEKDSSSERLLFCLVRDQDITCMQSIWQNAWEFREFEHGSIPSGKNEWYRFGVGTSPNGTVIGSFYDDDYNELCTLVNQTIHQDNEWWVDLTGSRGGTEDATLYVYFDYVRVRKFTDPEPSYSIGPEEPLPATVDVDPNSLNLKSNGEWITAYIELPEGYNVSDIDVPIMQINGAILVDSSAPTKIGDYDLDGVPDLMVKFDRASVIEWLGTIDYSEDTGKSYLITFTITGEVLDIAFEGSDTIRVIY